MEVFLREINKAVDLASGALGHNEAQQTRKEYRFILKRAQIECPAPKRSPGKQKPGRLKRSKARNLLERLIDYEDDVLRFMDNPMVPFTNNRGENDIRMTKVHQKISGCFRSMTGATMFRFCRILG